MMARDKAYLEAERAIEEARHTGATVLNLSHNQLTSLPESITQLTNLQKLDLSNNQLMSLPESIAQLTNLQLLYLSGNQLTSLPESIAQLTNLQLLYLNGNQLISLPESIAQLTNLQSLYLSFNQLIDLPESIAQLTNLQSLSLSFNQLMILPENITHLTNLQLLDLSGNQLTNLPESITQLTNLQLLYLNGNQLMSLPESIVQLTNLQSLNLSSNQLMSLLESMTKFINLQALDISHNQLTSLPKSITQLTNLQLLDLSFNQLMSLPESIDLLTNLQSLDISHNQLMSLPKSITQLTNLQSLYLYENDGLNLPPEVLGSSWQEVRYYKEVAPAKPQEILDYYFRLRGGKRPLNEAKLILVGYGDVGKTSLVNRLVHKTFDKDSKKTEGIQITQWPIQLNGNEDVRLNIWDFGGQEIMHATHQFFLTQRSLYILVLSGRQGHEDADAEYWLNLIQNFGNESPVIIVLNKIKEHPFDVNRRGLKQKFPDIKDFIETDCEDDLGLDKLYLAIERETDCLKHLRDAFPSSWFGIKDKLAAMTENFITFERYRSLCNEQGETDGKSQNSLASFLHSLGIILNYNDDPRLQDTHVLNPHWVTQGIYTILNAETLANKKGELNVCDFATILDSTDYPSERHSFLFELMRKFELCVRFPDDEGRYLIPQLLDKQQPPEAEIFVPTECLNFQYHYASLPEGLLPRFIVRTYILSTDQPRWRTGVILEFEGNRALVKADVQDKRVYIFITGAPSSRRRLLAIIRSDFDHIHNIVCKTSKPQEMVPIPDHPDVLIPYKKLQVMENKGTKLFEDVVGEDVIEFNVTKLLNGVDLEGTRRPQLMKDSDSKPLRLFYSYSHKDETLRDELETHLKLMQRQGLIETWSDRRITAGQEWKDKIDENLERAEIILLLVSADFIASDYCYDIEMKRALERHEKKEASVIPIIVRDVSWHSALFGKLQALPKDGKAVTIWPNKDTAWRNVSEGIEKVIKEWKR
jgi:internalin A